MASPTTKLQARATRATMTASVRRAPAPRVLTAQRIGQPPLIVALSRSDPGTAYVLDADSDGRWLCPCPAHGWRGDCAHVRAASVRHATTTERTS